jgi:hypothetical protein
MHPLVQSAIDAARQGDKTKSIDLVRQVLTSNPNDVDAWMVLAAVVDDPERKRQCLNRVLTIDPTNSIAREELLDMDRAHMSAVPSQPVVEPTSKTSPQPEPPTYSSSAFSYEAESTPEPTPFSSQPVKEESVPAPKPAAKPRVEKPQVFQYSLITRIVTYFFFVLFGCMTLIAFQSLTAALIPCGLALMMLPVIWIISAKVELNEKGIRTSQMYGLMSNQASWESIARIKSSSMQQNLQLQTRKGNKLKISSQVHGYPVIVETLRQKRPDLFGAAVAKSNAVSAGNEASPSMGSNSTSVAPSSRGTRTFTKEFFKQYGTLFIFIPLWVYLTSAAITSSENRTWTLITIGICGIMILIPFFQVNSVKVEADHLIIETIFEKKVLQAKEISEIKMQSVRGRYGRVTNFVNITLVKGMNYPLQGFTDGDEIIYGILSNWWNAHRNR